MFSASLVTSYCGCWGRWYLFHLWRLPLSTGLFPRPLRSQPQELLGQGPQCLRGRRKGSVFLALATAGREWSGQWHIVSQEVRNVVLLVCPILRPRRSNHLRTQRTLGSDSWPHDLGLPAEWLKKNFVREHGGSFVSQPATVCLRNF